MSFDRESMDPVGAGSCNPEEQGKQMHRGASQQATPMQNQGLKAPESRGHKETSDLPPHQEMGVLTFAEKKFLLAVERGDVATTRR